jgi:hypothetical protein
MFAVDPPASPLHRGPRVTHRAALGLALATLLILMSPYIVPAIVTAVKDRWKRISFDSSTWKKSLIRDRGRGYLRNHPVRQLMVDDLLRRHELVGMPLSEVVSLLGKPTTRYSRYDLAYILGNERGGWFAIDSEWLVIRFGPDQRVQEARLAVD